MAPELAGGGRADERSDVYGLGAVLYEALTGQPPFPGHDVRALLVAVLFEPIRPIAEVRGEPIAAELDAITMRCLVRDPDQRYASAADLAHALSSWSLAHHWEPTRARLRSRSRAAGAAGTARQADQCGSGTAKISWPDDQYS
jgi:serine/threonine protein kinase